MMSSKRLVVICASLFFTNLTIWTLFILLGSLDTYFINIEGFSEKGIIVPDQFLSMGVDASELERFSGELDNDKLIKLTRALSPAHLRLGGTMSDRLIFTSQLNTTHLNCQDCVGSSTPVCNHIRQLCANKFLPFFLMTAAQWTKLNRFAVQANLTLLFCVNVLLRDGDGWDDTNARELIEFSKKSKFHVDWQLGNEPNSFPHTFNVTVSPEQLAVDFRRLRALLRAHGYQDTLLAGPDTTRPQPARPSALRYMLHFLGNGSDAIDVRSWHQYYLNARTAKLEDFWKPETLDLLKSQLETMASATQAYERLPTWLSETSSAYGGGAPGLSDSFAATPLWLDKLGLCARHKISVVIRQSLIGGNYSLLDKHFDPSPDWWVSMLFKKLVGNQVLNVTCNTKFQRFYAHCTNKNYDNDGAITLYGMNLQLSKIKFLLNGTNFKNDNLTIEEYVFGAPSNNRMTKLVLLNGKKLMFDSKLPKPVILDNGPHIVLPPYSVGFWVIKNSSLNVCKSSI